MKTIIQFLILLLSTVHSFARCGGGSFTFWPSSSVIKENSIFIVDGNGLYSDIITKVGTDYKVYLKSGTEKIGLVIREKLVGQFHSAQLILKPEQNLTVGKEYDLFIENIKHPSKAESWQSKMKWKVVAGKDNTAPVWVVSPFFKNSTYYELGCGPETFANFQFLASDKSDFLIRTTVKNLTIGKETTYCLKANKNLIEIGHGMCFGPFDFKDGDKFEVEFGLIDASGNVTVWNEQRINFNRPS